MDCNQRLAAPVKCIVDTRIHMGVSTAYISIIDSAGYPELGMFTIKLRKIKLKKASKLGRVELGGGILCGGRIWLDGRDELGRSGVLGSRNRDNGLISGEWG